MRRYLVWFAVGVLLSTPIQAQVSFRYPSARIPTAAPTRAAVDYSKIRTVAVLSGIGSTVTVQKQRTIGWKRTEFASADWGVDPFVVSKVREYLGDRFMFKDVSYDVRAMARLPATVLRDTNKTVRGFFSSVPKDVDAYIVVRRQSISREGTMSGSAPGLALYDPAFGDNPKRDDDDARPIIVANYAIDILSPARLDVIATASSQIRYRPDGEPYFAELIGDPDLKTNDAELNDPQRERLRSEFERLLSVSLADTLRALDIDAALPPVAGTRRIVPAPTEGPFANIRTVGVVSAIGDHFHFGRGISSEPLSIPAWDVDAHVEDLARTILSQRFEVKDANVDRTALLRSTVRDGYLNFNPKIQGLYPTSDVDAYVLFLKFPMPLEFGDLEGLGLGLLNHETARSPTQNALFAHYAVVVVNARDLKMIRAITGTMSPDFAPRPAREVDGSLWPDSLAQLSADQREGIRQSLFNLLSESVEETLLRMGLAGNAISYAPGVRAEECWPRPSNAGQEAAMGAMFGMVGVGMAAAANGSAIGRLPMQFDEKGLVC